MAQNVFRRKDSLGRRYFYNCATHRRTSKQAWRTSIRAAKHQATISRARRAAEREAKKRKGKPTRKKQKRKQEGDDETADIEGGTDIDSP